MQAKSNFQFTKIRTDAFSEEFIQWIIPNQSSKSGFKSTVNGTVAFPVEFTKGVKLTYNKKARTTVYNENSFQVDFNQWVIPIKASFFTSIVIEPKSMKQLAQISYIILAFMYRLHITDS